MNGANLACLRRQHTAGFARLNFGCFLIEAGQAAINLEEVDGQLLLQMAQVGLG